MRSAYIEQNSGAGGYLAPYQRITAAVTLTAVEGTNYTFWVEENTPTGAITIAAGTAIIFGKVNETEVDTSDDGPGSSGATGVSNVILGTSAIKGDFLEFTFSHGAYYMFGSSAADGAVTTS